MLRGNLSVIITGVIICVALLYLIIPFDFMLTKQPHSLAFVPHEDPEMAEQMFSGIPSFVIDPAYLEFVLQMDMEEVRAMLNKRPFRHISQGLEETINNFNNSMAYISSLVGKIDEDLDQMRRLVGQYQFDEVSQLVIKINAKLSQADLELTRIKEITKITGISFLVDLVPLESNLRKSYDNLGEWLDKGRERLDLNKNILANFSKALAGELPGLTKVTLILEPTVASVGENIRFEGELTFEGKPLAGRKVDILLNGPRHATVETDAYGHYQGRLEIPYRYIPEMEVQALYYPEDEDIELYPFSLSRVMELQVLFYEAELEITVEDKTYPGLETELSGSFDYGQSPLPVDERKVEIYFDDVLIGEVLAREDFRLEVTVDPETEVGEHIITLSAAPVGRYAPAVTSTILKVIRATPVLDINIPRITMIPGEISLGGKLYSEFGPLSEASIKIDLGSSRVELLSSEDGTFDTNIKVGIGFGVIGSQDLVIQVFPKESWHATLSRTSSLLVVNWVSGSLLAAILLLFGIYLPDRLKRRPGVYKTKRVVEATPMVLPELAPTYSNRVAAFTTSGKRRKIPGEPRDRIIYWYRLIARLLQGITRVLLGPQQTLREFAKESSRILGPRVKYFAELTGMVEKLLYSQHKPDLEDVEVSWQLSYKIEEETKWPVTEQTVDPGSLNEEEV